MELNGRANVPTNSPNSPAEQPGGCAKVHIISARGSTESQEGSPLLAPIGKAIGGAFPGLTCYTGLPYPATVNYVETSWPPSYDLGGSPTHGIANLTTLLNQSAAQCPEQGFVLMGYSQGALIIGDALLPPQLRLAGHDAEEISPTAAKILHGTGSINSPIRTFLHNYYKRSGLRLSFGTKITSYSTPAKPHRQTRQHESFNTSTWHHPPTGRSVPRLRELDLETIEIGFAQTFFDSTTVDVRRGGEGVVAPRDTLSRPHPKRGIPS